MIREDYQIPMVLMTASRAREKKLPIEMEVDDQLPSVLYGDEVPIRQIINTLLPDAVSYTRMGNALECATQDGNATYIRGAS